MKCLLIDDEIYALEELEYVINSIDSTALIDKANYYIQALELIEKQMYDIVFLDIEMPGINGIELAKRIKEYQPHINIIMVTAYSQYALDAIKLYVSDYILKPVMKKDVEKALNNLRYHTQKRLQVQCFGNFEVFYDSKIIPFKRKKSKELFAYLVDLQGASTNTEELCAILWEDDYDIDKKKNYLRQIISDLKRTLKQYNLEHILIKTRDCIAIDVNQIDCDVYHYLNGDPQAIQAYRGEYMKQYSWAYLSLKEEYRVEGEYYD